MRFRLAACLVALAPTLGSGAEPAELVTRIGKFRELPVGAVQPRGWIQRWLARQATGLTGHPENLAYPYDTCLLTGTMPPPTVKHGEEWWPYEQAGYFIDAAVRLNHLVDSPELARLTASNLAGLRANSGTGRFGASHWGWPNAVIGRALLAEQSATGAEDLGRVLRMFFAETPRWRSRDGFVFEQALAVYGQTGDPRLLAFARDAYDRFFVRDPKSFSHTGKIAAPAPLREHGVTAAEQLKLLPLLYSYTGDATLLELAERAYRKVEADSLMPDGGMVSSENLGTAAFDSLHESCDLSDWSWSLGYHLLAGGGAHWADLIERTTFNALPGTVTKDFRQLQYFSSANQVLAANTACPRIAPTRMSYRAAHDTECCSGNISRAMPNYVLRMWARHGDGLAATLYGPSEVTAAVLGRPVTITEETDYPFRETFVFRVKVAKPLTFPLSLRIPEWCAGATVQLNGRPHAVEAAPGSFITLTRRFQDGDTVQLRLPMAARTEAWFAGRAATVVRGPLVFALPVPEHRVEHTQDTESIRRVLKGNNIQGFPAVEFFPAGEWRFGFAAAQPLKVVESPMPENPFVAADAPVRIEAMLVPLPHWQAAWRPLVEPLPADLKTAPHNPNALPAGDELREAGAPRAATLVPYGATHLRLTTLPIVDAHPN